jgi:hypothetical protein
LIVTRADSRINYAARWLSEQTLERVVKILAAKYPRPEHVVGYIADFKFPWNEHFPAA